MKAVPSLEGGVKVTRREGREREKEGNKLTRYQKSISVMEKRLECNKAPSQEKKGNPFQRPQSQRYISQFSEFNHHPGRA